VVMVNRRNVSCQTRDYDDDVDQSPPPPTAWVGAGRG